MDFNFARHLLAPIGAFTLTLPLVFILTGCISPEKKKFERNVPRENLPTDNPSPSDGTDVSTTGAGVMGNLSTDGNETPTTETPTTQISTKVAFIGDTGVGKGFQKVLNLIKEEGADLTIVAGDTAYDTKDVEWDQMVTSTLDSKDVVLVAAGNHEYNDSDFSTVRSLGKARLSRNSNVKCSGDYAEQMSCSFQNLFIVLSSIGSGGNGSISHESFLENELQVAPSGTWRICTWHKNQKTMQTGGKKSEVGWDAYEICRKRGAIIFTGHEHSYSRTHLLSSMSDQEVVNKDSDFTIEEGKTFAFVSGLGGNGIRDQERDGDWWAKIYTSTQRAKYGALFGTFYESHADFYFKNVSGDIVDKFTVRKGY